MLTLVLSALLCACCVKIWAPGCQFWAAFTLPEATCGDWKLSVQTCERESDAPQVPWRRSWRGAPPSAGKATNSSNAPMFSFTNWVACVPVYPFLLLWAGVEGAFFWGVFRLFFGNRGSRRNMVPDELRVVRTPPARSTQQRIT